MFSLYRSVRLPVLRSLFLSINESVRSRRLRPLKPQLAPDGNIREFVLLREGRYPEPLLADPRLPHGYSRSIERLPKVASDDNAPTQESHQGAIVAVVSIVVGGERNRQNGGHRRAVVAAVGRPVGRHRWAMDSDS